MRVRNNVNKTLTIIISMMLVMQMSQAYSLTDSVSVKDTEVGYDISNGSVSSITLDASSLKLTIEIQTNGSGKLDLEIPRTLLDAKAGTSDDIFFIIIDGFEATYKELSASEKSRTISVQFSDNTKQIEVIGTKVKQEKPSSETSMPTTATKSGCLIATAAFGSEMAPQVQQLRETRDNIVMKTQSGVVFMTAFNSVYYSFAPTVADWERQNPIFKEAVKITITPLLTTLSMLNYVNIHSEGEMLFYGIGVILLNVGIYFVAPAFVIIRLKSHK